MTNLFKIGDEVKIINGAHYLNNGKAVPNNILNMKVFVRDVKDDRCVVARAKTGPLLGEISIDSLSFANENKPVIEPYIIQVLNNNYPIYHSPSKNSGIIRRVDETSLFSIVDERNGFGKLLVGAGWIDLEKVKKLK
jgi:hypothetical protein